MLPLLLTLLSLQPGAHLSTARAADAPDTPFGSGSQSAGAQDDATLQEVVIAEQLQLARADLLRECLKLAGRATEIGFASAARGLYTAVVDLDPENAAGRKGLGMHKRSGVWQVRSSRPRKDKVDLEEVEPFLSARAALVERAIARVDAAFRDVELTPTRLERRRRELDVLNSIEPDNDALRERTGWAKEPDTGAWTLREVVEARRRFDANAELLKEIRAQLPPTSAAELDEHVAATRVAFPSVLASPTLRVAATLGGSEAQAIHDLVFTELQYLQRTFEREPRFSLPTSVISLSDGTLKQAFFSQHPLVRPARLDEHYALYGSWIRQQVVISSPTPEERKDMATFLTTTAFLGQMFGEHGDSGWIRQSLASYLSATVCNSHLSFLVTKDHYGLSSGPPWPSRVPPSLDGWLASARPFLADDKPLPDFIRSLTVPTRNMTWEDVVVGYAFAAYLCEGRRDDLVVILKRLGRGEEKLSVLEGVLQLPMPVLRARLAQWIDLVGAID